MGNGESVLNHILGQNAFFWKVILLITITNKPNSIDLYKLLNCLPVRGWQPCLGSPATGGCCVFVHFRVVGQRGKKFLMTRNLNINIWIVVKCTEMSVHFQAQSNTIIFFKCLLYNFIPVSRRWLRQLK